MGFAGYEGLFSMAMMLLALRYGFRAAYFTSFGVLHLPLTISTLLSHTASDKPALLIVIILQHLLLFSIALLRSEDSRIDSASRCSSALALSQPGHTVYTALLTTIGSSMSGCWLCGHFCTSALPTGFIGKSGLSPCISPLQRSASSYG